MRGVLIACVGGKFERTANRDMDRAAAGPRIMNGVDLEEAGYADGDNGNTKADGHHADARTESVNCAVGCASAFGKNQGTIAAVQEVAGISEGASGARHLLR